MSNHGLLASALTWNAVDRGFKSCSDQTKDYKISICGLFVKHAGLRSNWKD